ncbi:MAG: 5'-nucleotidase C-terminal domain-containing protein, partial [Muribaculaceae bacterium]|nr:5'-nucleotidase C-terminal domain-containing protein [Muribaculaceae bacterium]
DIPNADGKMITVCQTGGSGKTIGVIDVCFDNGGLKAKSRLLPVDACYDSRIDSSLANYIAPYKHIVDSMMNNVVIISDVELPNRRSAQTMNWIADLAYSLGNRIYSKPIDLAIMNKGGMRREMPVGNISEGLLGAMFPFENRLVVLRIKGKDLLDAFSVMASRGGDAVSNGVYIEFDANNHITKATLHGHKIKEDETYTLLTLDYLADGGDYMAPLKNAERVAADEEKFGSVVISELKQRGKRGEHITASFDSRMKLKN